GIVEDGRVVLPDAGHGLGDGLLARGQRAVRRRARRQVGRRSAAAVVGRRQNARIAHARVCVCVSGVVAARRAGTTEERRDGQRRDHRSPHGFPRAAVAPTLARALRRAPTAQTSWTGLSGGVSCGLAGHSGREFVAWEVTGRGGTWREIALLQR